MTKQDAQAKPDTDSGEPVKELDEATLANAAGGKHPAKVTVPDLKLGVGYDA